MERKATHQECIDYLNELLAFKGERVFPSPLPPFLCKNRTDLSPFVTRTVLHLSHTRRYICNTQRVTISTHIRHSQMWVPCFLLYPNADSRLSTFLQ